MQVKACPDDGGWSDRYPVKQGHGENKWPEQILRYQIDELSEGDLLHLYFFCRHDVSGVLCISIPAAEE